MPLVYFGSYSTFVLIHWASFLSFPPSPMNSLAKTVTWILGVVLLLVGLIGFVNNPILGIFQTDTIHNAVHILSGVVGLAAASAGASKARLFLIVFGVIYALVTVVGFVNAGDILGLFTTNRADDYLHAAIALVSLGVGFGSKN